MMLINVDKVEQTAWSEYYYKPLNPYIQIKK